MRADLECLKVLSTEQGGQWRSLLPAGQSAFGCWEFASIVEKHRDVAARLILLGSPGGNGLVVYPLFLRAISSLPFGASVPGAQWDAASPEFTGPLLLESNTAKTGAAFRECLERYCQEGQIVTEFAHLHPWRSAPGAQRPENVHRDREIVYVDLAQSATDLWERSLTYACRKNIARARRGNVRVFAAETPEQIRQFHQIYIHTMERNRAQARYYYPLQFFMDVFEQMPKNARFALAEHGGRIVAGTLFLYDDQDVYSYLGGAYSGDQRVRPTNAVIYHTILWAQDLGKKRLILGGGYRPNDGIFRFKASFSPLRAAFSVYRQIHMPDQYEALCRRWAAYTRTGREQSRYFPLYRSPLGQSR